MTRIYGIANCSTVKKARNWLEQQQIDAEFIDFKKTPPSLQLLAQWHRQLPISMLLNRKGTTWRQLTPQQQAAAADETAALALLQAHPSLIKRPLIEHEGSLLAGFDADTWSRLFALPQEPA